MIWLVWIGVLVFVLVILWLSSSSGRRSYPSYKTRLVTKSLLAQKQEDDRYGEREMEKHRRGLRR